MSPPSDAPPLNAYTERFVRTIKDSCLERMVLIGEGSRRRGVGARKQVFVAALAIVTAEGA